ncbi:CD82 antigen, partial [Zootermopsis nevadensis]
LSFQLVGLAVIVLSVWMLTDTAFYVSVASGESSYYTGIYIFLATGALMFIVGFLGCCGAYRESPCMLVSVSIAIHDGRVVPVCFSNCVYIKFGLKSVHNSDKLEVYVKDAVRSTVQQEYGVVDTRTKTFDAIQEGLHCCGATGPQDWAGSEYNKAGKTAFNVLVSSVVQVYNIPTSCCRQGTSEEFCKTAVKAGIAAQLSTAVYSEGCIDKLIHTLKKHMSIVVGVGIAIIIIECLGLIFSLILCCEIRTMDRYKA